MDIDYSDQLLVNLVHAVQPGCYAIVQYDYTYCTKLVRHFERPRNAGLLGLRDNLPEILKLTCYIAW